MDNDDIVRPGISAAFLRRNNIRHVDESEALAAVGYKQPGIIIPYPDLHGPHLKINGRPFCRLRLDHPTASAKYLSPRGAGAQLYVPQGVPFGKELVVAEGEFKAMALCEAGIRSVAISGICSAMSQGELIPSLQKLLSKWPPETLFFLGDADTCFLFDFSREALKLAAALPAGCNLKLPRIPITMPNGIDDIREKLGAGFPDFWQQITEAAITVERKLSADTLARKLITSELPAIASHGNKEVLIEKIVELGSHFDPLNRDLLAGVVKDVLKLSVTTFRKSAARAANARKAEAAGKTHEKRKQDVADAVNDPRPKIEIPTSRERLSSEFARELGPILARRGFFAKSGLVVSPDTEKASLVALTARAFRTRIEDHVIPFRVFKTPQGNLVALNRTISKEEAETVLESSQFIRQLPTIRAVNNVRLPVVRAAGRLELLPEGYDPESMIFTTPGGPEIEEPEPGDSKKFLDLILEEFCFLKDDRERAISVAISAMLTLFLSCIIPKGAQRPGFLYTANAEGSGKTLLARLAIVPRIGFTPTGSLPEQEEEIQKRVFAAAIAGSSVLFMDNGKRHVSSGALESALTAPFIEGRILGKSQMTSVENLLTVFLTGNGATISPDLRRRMLHVDLFLREARAEDRNIAHPLDEPAIRNLRSEILSALWGLTLDWDRAGRPVPKLKLNGCEPWSDVVAGILEHAGYSSPCTPVRSSLSGDRDTQNMEKLVSVMHPMRELRFGDLVDLCREHALFTGLVGEDDQDFDRGKKNIFSKILTKFNGRIFTTADPKIFPTGAVFHVQRRSKDVKVFYVDQIP